LAGQGTAKIVIILRDFGLEIVGVKNKHLNRFWRF
jgi:hypothetical protein